MKRFLIAGMLMLLACIILFGNEKKIVDLKTIWSPVSVTFRLVDEKGNMEDGAYTAFFAPFYVVVSVVDKTTGDYNKKVPTDLIKAAARYSYMAVDFGIGGGLFLGVGVFPLIVLGAVFVGVSNMSDYYITRYALIGVGATFLVFGAICSITGIIFIIVAATSATKCKEKKKEIIDILNSVKSGMNLYKDKNLRVSFDLNLSFSQK